MQIQPGPPIRLAQHRHGFLQQLRPLALICQPHQLLARLRRRPHGNLITTPRLQSCLGKSQSAAHQVRRWRVLRLGKNCLRRHHHHLLRRHVLRRARLCPHSNRSRGFLHHLRLLFLISRRKFFFRLSLSFYHFLFGVRLQLALLVQQQPHYRPHFLQWLAQTAHVRIIRTIDLFLVNLQLLKNLRGRLQRRIHRNVEGLARSFHGCVKILSRRLVMLQRILPGLCLG